MGDKTAISWTDATWNPVLGCDHVSPGCDNCYAARNASTRLAHIPAYEGLAVDGRFTGKIRLLPERLDQPLRWRRPRRIFVNSMSDLFHKDIPDEYIAQVFAVMALAERHTFQVLTKRHARMRSLLSSNEFREQFGWHAAGLAPYWTADEQPWPLPNVWLGVSVENQQWADIRIPALLDTPAAVRWLSCEPLLGPVKLPLIEEHDTCTCGVGPHGHYGIHERGCGTTPGPAWGNLHWVVAGGESGPKARPMHPAWARSLRDQCQQVGVPFHFKQFGEHTPYLTDWDNHGGVWVNQETGATVADESQVPDTGSWQQVWRVGKHAAGRELDGRTWDEYPEVAG